VVGKLPLTTEDFQAVPIVAPEGAFRLVKFSGTGAWVALPGWQVIFAAIDPIAILANTDVLPLADPGELEEVLLVVDRGQRTWNETSYFVVKQAGQLQIEWFETLPEQPLLGQVILVLRPKQVLDEEFNKQLWQLDE
jgi:hypothetical protein